MVFDLILRAATRDDLPALVRIYNDAIALRYATGHLDPFSEAERVGWFEAHAADSCPLYVACSDGKVAGYAAFDPYRSGRGAFRATREISYYVAVDCQRRGVASALLAHALADCPRLGVRNLVSFLMAHNGPSRALLERHLFTLWGTLPGIAEIDGHSYDHVLYGRRLG
ncbi:MAG TPA: GNAT family N-acetyltransferase [Gammaproteobacteria bacterium]